MSILIKGMGIPVYGCSECPLANKSYRLEAEETQLACYAKGEWVSDDGERPDWCPLIEVPEHGDLIDREPFIEFIEKNWDSYDQWFIGQLEARPIVIPADKDGET